MKLNRKLVTQIRDCILGLKGKLNSSQFWEKRKVWGERVVSRLQRHGLRAWVSDVPWGNDALKVSCAYYVGEDFDEDSTGRREDWSVRMCASAKVSRPDVVNQAHPQPLKLGSETSLKALVIDHVGPLASSDDVRKLLESYGQIRSVVFTPGSTSFRKDNIGKNLRTVTVLFEVAADLRRAQHDWDTKSTLDSEKIRIHNLGPSGGTIKEGSRAWRTLVGSGVERDVERRLAGPQIDGRSMPSVVPKVGVPKPHQSHNNAQRTGSTSLTYTPRKSLQKDRPQPLAASKTRSSPKMPLATPPMSAGLQLPSPTLHFNSPPPLNPHPRNQAFGERESHTSYPLSPISPSPSSEPIVQPLASLRFPLPPRPPVAIGTSDAEPQIIASRASSSSERAKDPPLAPTSIRPKTPSVASTLWTINECKILITAVEEIKKAPKPHPSTMINLWGSVRHILPVPMQEKWGPEACRKEYERWYAKNVSSNTSSNQHLGPIPVNNTSASPSKRPASFLCVAQHSVKKRPRLADFLESSQESSDSGLLNTRPQASLSVQLPQSFFMDVSQAEQNGEEVTSSAHEFPTFGREFQWRASESSRQALASSTNPSAWKAAVEPSASNTTSTMADTNFDATIRLVDKAIQIFREDSIFGVPAQDVDALHTRSQVTAAQAMAAMDRIRVRKRTRRQEAH
ncbi:hypothetical protein P7C70_g2918, partial [Phenoliferia sp. Uapishka_3]